MKKTFMSALILLLALTIILLGCSAIHTSAKNENPVRTGYDYREYEIQKNDTLWGISEKFADGIDLSTNQYLGLIREVNGLSTDRIIPGNKILIAYRR